jgi:shikimate dehydrogenase
MAEQHGHVTINGAGMLIEQGALAFELWTGKSAPRDIMRVAVGTLL